MQRAEPFKFTFQQNRRMNVPADPKVAQVQIEAALAILNARGPADDNEIEVAVFGATVRSWTADHHEVQRAAIKALTDQGWKVREAREGGTIYIYR